MRDRPDPPQLEPMRRAMTRFFTEQRDAIVQAMEAKPMGLKYGLVRKDDDIIERWLQAWGVTGSTWNERAEILTRPMMQAVLNDSVRVGGEWVRQANDAAQVVDSLDFAEPSFGLENPRAAEMLRRQRQTHQRGLEEMNERTAEIIRGTLAEGFEQGDSLNGMQRRVREVFDARDNSSGEPMTRWRAERIARTEVAQAQGEASLAGAMNSGVRVRKLWVLSANPCEFCRAAAREFARNPVEVDKPFYKTGNALRGTLGGIMKLDFRDINGPPLHPNCSCDMQLVVEGGGVVGRPAA